MGTLLCVVDRRAWDCSLWLCGIWAGRCRDVHTQAPGYLALLYGRARTLASVDLTPANGFSGQSASGFAGVAGVAGSTLGGQRRERVVCLH